MSGGKCVPATIVSITVTSSLPDRGRTTAPSSPTPATTSGESDGREKKRRISSNSSTAFCLDLDFSQHQGPDVRVGEGENAQLHRVQLVEGPVDQAVDG